MIRFHKIALTTMAVALLGAAIPLSASADTFYRYSYTSTSPVLIESSVASPVMVDRTYTAPAMVETQTWVPTVIQTTPTILEREVAAPVVIERRPHHLLHLGLPLLNFGLF
jgi:hypothetical protein